MNRPTYDPASFKDPSGRVYFADGKVYREIDRESSEALGNLVKSPGFNRIKPLLVPTEFMANTGAGPDVLNHERIEAVTYCYEWATEQWRDAALLTLDLQLELLESDYILKDATPFNVLFKDGHPIFIDYPSMVPYQSGEHWVALTEFFENFLYPLLVAEYLRIPVQKFSMATLGRINLQEVRELLRKVSLFKPGIFKYVFLPHFIKKMAAKSQNIESNSRVLPLDKATLLKTCREIRHLIAGLKLATAESHWETYASDCHYAAIDHKNKKEFISQQLAEFGPFERAIDLGANTGEYSKILVKNSKVVVAVESDIACINEIYKTAAKSNLNISPVYMDFVSPSPGVGWANTERPSFYQRFDDSDMVLALAVIHHIRISGNVPLAMILQNFAKLGKNIIVEWVPQEDPMCQKLLARKKNTYTDYTIDTFLLETKKHFDIVGERTLNQNRVLFALKRK